MSSLTLTPPGHSTALSSTPPKSSASVAFSLPGVLTYAEFVAWAGGRGYEVEPAEDVPLRADAATVTVNQLRAELGMPAIPEGDALARKMFLAG